MFFSLTSFQILCFTASHSDLSDVYIPDLFWTLIFMYIYFPPCVVFLKKHKQDCLVWKLSTFFLIGVELFYNVVLVSAVQRSGVPSAIQQILISYLFYTYQCIYVNPNLPVHPIPLSPLGVHTFVIYICVSISALQTGSSVPFFQIPHICINIQYLFSLSDLTSLCMIVSRSIHVSTNDPILFLLEAFYF